MKEKLKALFLMMIPKKRQKWWCVSGKHVWYGVETKDQLCPKCHWANLTVIQKKHIRWENFFNFLSGLIGGKIVIFLVDKWGLLGMILFGIIFIPTGIWFFSKKKFHFRPEFFLFGYVALMIIQLLVKHL